MKYKILLLVSSVFLFIVEGFSQSTWQSLFDGKSLKGWKQMTGTADYKVEDSAIVGTTVLNSPNSFLVSDKKFTGDFVLELEFKIVDTAMNAGVQFHSNYDAKGNNGKPKVFGYQFEIDGSARKWSGGIYDEGRRDWLYPVSLNPRTYKAFQLNIYNKVRIECKGNEVKTWLNGMAISYLSDTIVKNQGLIALQVHSISNEEQVGEKVYFKNIRIQNLTGKASEFSSGVYVVNLNKNSLTEYEKKEGWRLLFDGKTTTGWKGAYKPGFPEKGWEVKNGLLSVVASEGKESANGGDIVTTEQFSAFDLSFQFKLAKGGNSGVKYFVTLSENNEGSAIGLEYQLLDDSLHPDAKLGIAGNRTLASLYDLIKANKQSRFTRQPGEWNTGRIVVHRDNLVEHYLNGVKVLEYYRGDKRFRNLVAVSKYKVWPNFGEASQGYILLQDHGDQVSFKSIKIKKLR